MTTSRTLDLPPLYPRQQLAVFCPERVAIIEGSTKCGKTQGMILWQLVQVVQRPGVHRWIAPTYAVARIAYDRVSKMLRGSGVIAGSTVSPMELRTVTGAVWQFRSAENPDALYGEDCQSVVLDEASRMPEAAWHAAQSTLYATGGHARIIGNVRGKNWFYHLARRAENGEPDHRYTKITAWDAVDAREADPTRFAGLPTREALEAMRRSYPPEVFAELFECVPMDGAVNPFGAEHIDAAIMDAPSRHPAVVFGIDVARKRDWTVVVGLDRYGREAAYGRWRHMDWADLTEHIRGILPPGARGYIDATGVGDVIAGEIARTHPAIKPYVFTAQSKQTLMESLQVAFQRREVGVHTPELIRELRDFEYAYGATGRVTYSAPAGAHDDTVMALALAHRAGRQQGLIEVYDPAGATAHNPPTQLERVAAAPPRQLFQRGPRRW